MRVLLIIAPFGLIEYPNLAASLLKSEAREAGFDCDLRYASLEFAKQVGYNAYTHAYTIDAQLLIPERIFAGQLFGDRIPPWQDFWQQAIVPYAEPLADRIMAPGDKSTTNLQLAKLEAAAAEFVAGFATDPDVEGYDLFAFTTSYGQNCGSLSIARELKQRFPDVPIVLGGANCAGGMGEKLLELFPFVDYVCVEDGDLAWPALLRALRDGEPVDVVGMVSRDEHGRLKHPTVRHQMVTDLDALPIPDFSDFFASFEPGEEPAGVVGVPMETSRGCWWGAKHHCIFCGLNRDSMAHRKKSAPRAEAEIRELCRTYGVKKIYMTDNILPLEYLKELMPNLAQDPPHEQIFFEVKANLSKPDLRALQQARVLHLQPGIESLSTRVLKLMDKGMDCLGNLQLLKWATELGMRVSWNILCGFPGETREDYDELAALFPKIHHLQPSLGFSQITIDRFSPLFQDPERFGIRIRPSRSYRYVYPFPEKELRELAYWFAQESDALDGTVTLAAPDYARSAYRAHMIWRRLCERVDFSYERVAEDRIVVNDTRGVSAARERELTPLETRVFDALDSRRSESGLLRALGASGAVVTAEALAPVLERFREWCFVHEDGGRMLALATERKGFELETRPSFEDVPSAFA